MVLTVIPKCPNWHPVLGHLSSGYSIGSGLIEPERKVKPPIRGVVGTRSHFSSHHVLQWRKDITVSKTNPPIPFWYRVVRSARKHGHCPSPMYHFGTVTSRRRPNYDAIAEPSNPTTLIANLRFTAVRHGACSISRHSTVTGRHVAD